MGYQEGESTMNTATVFDHEVWLDVEEALDTCHSIAWDTCHKIYILMDEEQTNLMRSYDYDPIILAEGKTVAELLYQIQEWFVDSCSLRFVEAVRTVEGDPNEGYDSIIPQCFTFEEDTEE